MHSTLLVAVAVIAILLIIFCVPTGSGTERFVSQTTCDRVCQHMPSGAACKACRSQEGFISQATCERVCNSAPRGKACAKCKEMNGYGSVAYDSSNIGTLSFDSLDDTSTTRLVERLQDPGPCTHTCLGYQQGSASSLESAACAQCLQDNAQSNPNQLGAMIGLME